MKALHTKKFLEKKSTSDAAIPVQSQIKSRPFVANSASQSQKLTQTSEKAKPQGFNFAEIPVFSGMKPAISTKPASAEIQHIPTQSNVMQRADKGKERAQLSGNEENNLASRGNETISDDELYELLASLEEESSEDERSPQELFRDIDRLLAEFNDSQDSEENLLDRDGQEFSSGQSNSQDMQQEDESSIKELFRDIDRLLAELDDLLDSESKLDKQADKLPQQQQSPQQPPAPTRPAPPIPQQQQSPQQPLPATPKQEAQRLLPMDYTAREQAIKDLQQQKRSAFVNLVIEELRELDRQQAAIRGLEGRILSQAPQQEQQSAAQTSPQKVAEGMRQYEAYSDQTKLLGQDSTHTNVDQIALQNLPANDRDPGTALPNLPTDTPAKFGNDAAVIGETRDEVRAVGGLIILRDSYRRLRDGLTNKKKPTRERIANATGGAGEMTSAGTYTTIVGTQAAAAISHHIHQQDATPASGAIAGAREGGRIPPGTAGTSIPINAGQALGSILTTVPKLINYTDAAVKAIKKENFGGHKSVGRGVKNVADLTRSIAGAVKDASNLAQNSGAVAAEASKIVAGGAVAPAANAVVGSAEAIQGSYKIHKARMNKKGLDRIETEDTDTIDKLKQIQDKKIKRAAINTVLGNTTLAAGVVGFTAGPPGLIAATAMGAGVGAFQIGQWGTRKFKQKMRDKEMKGFDATKSTKSKNQTRSELAENVFAMLEGSGNKEKETIFSSIGLNENKKDSVVQQVYNDVLAQYLGSEELQQPTTPVNQILKLKGDKHNLKQEVSWDKLSDRDFPAEFRKLVKKAAIVEALKKR